MQLAIEIAHELFELSYTLPQDFTLFIILKTQNVDLWKRKLDWVVAKGGMVLLITHPDYMNFSKDRCGIDVYQMAFYKELLDYIKSYIKSKHEGQYWHVLPKEIARCWTEKMVKNGLEGNLKTEGDA